MKCLLLLLGCLFYLGSPALAGSNLVGHTKYEMIGPAAPFSPGSVTYQLVIYPSGTSGHITVHIADYEYVIYNS